MPRKVEWEELQPLQKHVIKAARYVQYQWPGIIEADDVEQELWLKFLESPGSIAKISKMDESKQYSSILYMANQIAAKERRDYNRFSGSYRYSMKEAKAYLQQSGLRRVLGDPDVSSYEEYVDAPTKEPAMQMNEIEADILVALGTLRERNEQYHEAIVLRYLLDEVPERGKMQVRLSRALEKLVDEMNRASRVGFMSHEDGPGTRKVLTREQARWVSKEGWDADYTPYPLDRRDNRTQPEVWERQMPDGQTYNSDGHKFMKRGGTVVPDSKGYWR